MRSPTSRWIFKRFGFTVSIRMLLWKVVPPTTTRAFQTPVGASVAVAQRKAYTPFTEVVRTCF
jgi:hypothetical protein